ncbi:MAG: hypothetical protein PWQ96_1675 [Clostridia bacterium]|jgi:hypothetical protein|nr:hypothetical protein [Clostridia bacterium]
MKISKEEAVLNENIEKIFTQDSKDKKQIAYGAKHMASRTGRIGSIKMPSDFAGKEYKKNSEIISYKIDEIIEMISQTPFLKSLILEKMDLDYQHFRSALETTIDNIFNINHQVLQAMLTELDNVKKEIQDTKSNISSDNILNTDNLSYETSDEIIAKKEFKKASNAKSIKECKERVFERLKETEEAGIRMTSNNVLKRHPVINYYLYKQKLWNGYKEMITEYNEIKTKSDSSQMN